MSLLDRLIGTMADPVTEPKMPVHQFMAALAEFGRGAFTRPQVVSAFQTDPNFLVQPSELAQLDDFLDQIDPALVPLEADRVAFRMAVHDVLMLGEQDSYTKQRVKTRLNIIAV